MTSGSRVALGAAILCFIVLAGAIGGKVGAGLEGKSVAPGNSGPHAQATQENQQERPQAPGDAQPQRPSQTTPDVAQAQPAARGPIHCIGLSQDALHRAELHLGDLRRALERSKPWRPDPAVSEGLREMARALLACESPDSAGGARPGMPAHYYARVGGLLEELSLIADPGEVNARFGPESMHANPGGRDGGEKPDARPPMGEPESFDTVTLVYQSHGLRRLESSLDALRSKSM